MFYCLTKNRTIYGRDTEQIRIWNMAPQKYEISQDSSQCNRCPTGLEFFICHRKEGEFLKVNDKSLAKNILKTSYINTMNAATTQKIQKKIHLFSVFAPRLWSTSLSVATVVHGDIQDKKVQWHARSSCNGDVEVNPFLFSEVSPPTNKTVDLWGAVQNGKLNFFIRPVSRFSSCYFKNKTMFFVLLFIIAGQH